MNSVRLLPIGLALLACGCGRSELDGPFAPQNVYVTVAPDAGTGTLPDLAAGGRAGNSGAAGRPGAAGAGGAAGPPGNGTVGGFGGALRFCKTDLDCGAGTPRCCSAGAVMVCEPGPCVTAGDEDGDNDSDHDHPGGHRGL
jgi:hypothetical protein